MTDMATARDSINAQVKAKVDAYNAANATTYQVFYDDVEKAQSDGKGPHFRVFIRHGSGDQITLGGVGNRGFERRGIVTVQVMVPFGDGFTLGDTLATLARNMFEGVTTPDGVWFRRVTPGQEMGKTGNWQQINVTANFEYTERR